MNKKIFSKRIGVLILISASCRIQTSSQVTIGSNVAPQQSSVLELVSNNKGLLLPRVSSTSSITNPVDGMIVFIVEEQCFKGYQNGAWTNITTGLNGSITALNCGNSSDAGTLTSGVAAFGVTTSVPYTGGNGGTYGAQTVASTGVTGLTATLSSGAFVTGDGVLTYTITGTPSGAGVATFPITVRGKSCSFSRTVYNAIPSTITLGVNQRYLMPSVYDYDYLPYSAPISAATLATTQAADGTNESSLIDYQGTITTSGVSLKIPCIATASGTLPAYSTSIWIPGSFMQDGIGHNLTLSWPATSYTSSTTSILATVASVGTASYLKKLDIQTGIGNDALGVLMGSFSYMYNSSGASSTFDLRIVAGIPDRMFGVADNNGATNTHYFLYMPVVGEDGNIWLNNNLGADYSNLTKGVFKHTSQASAGNDFHAYGSLFQWGRKPDGHELVTALTIISATLTPVVSGLSDNPTSASLIQVTASPYDWRATPSDNLWNGEVAVNNPCPAGYRLPTDPEISNYISKASITSAATAANSILKISLAGRRWGQNGSGFDFGTDFTLWTSTPSNPGASAYNLSIHRTAAYDRANAYTVRCIKN